MKSTFTVAHNHCGYAYIREVLENSVAVYCDIELGRFSTYAEAEEFIKTVDDKLSVEFNTHFYE